MNKRSLVVAAAALLLLSTGCFRTVRQSLGGDRQVDTGVPATFGSEHPDAATLTYDFGDGTPPQTGKLVKHAYAQPGRYRVVSLDGNTPVDAVVFTAVPRRVTRALPEKTNGVIFFRKLEGNLDAAVDFIEKLLGADAAQGFVEASPLVELGMELSASHTLHERGVDGEEGLGVFTLNEFKGTIALIGVTDGQKALSALVQLITRGGSKSWSGNDDTTRVRLRDGREAALLLDRGYLYLMVPDAPAPDAEFSDAFPDDVARDSGMNKTDFSPAITAIKSADALGLEGTGTLANLEDKVSAGNAYLYMNLDKTGQVNQQGTFASFQMRDNHMDVDGFIRSKRPWGARQTASLELLSRIPKGGLAAFSLSVPPEELATFFFGEPGGEQRTNAAQRLARSGVDFEALLSALTGDVAGALYFDAKAAMLAMAKAASPAPQFKGTLLTEAGITDAAALEKLFEALLKDSPVPVKRTKEAGFVRYNGVVEAQAVDVSLTKDKLTLKAGEKLSDAGLEDIGAQLRQQFGAETFGPGHLSAVVFVGKLREELAAVNELPGVPQAKVEMFKAFADAMLSQFPPIDVLFVDVSSAEGGAQVKGRVGLRKRSAP